MKAIQITADNQGMLASRFGVQTWDYDDRLPIGYFLVTDFGNDETYDLLTADGFQSTFSIGQDLLHGFVSISYI